MTLKSKIFVNKDYEELEEVFNLFLNENRILPTRIYKVYFTRLAYPFSYEITSSIFLLYHDFDEDV